MLCILQDKDKCLYILSVTIAHDNTIYLNPFKITIKLVIAIKLFYKSNLQESKLFII